MKLLNRLRSIRSHPANRNWLDGGLIRFLRWRIAARRGVPKEFFCKVGRIEALCPYGISSSNMMAIHGKYEFEEMSALERALGSGDSFIDVGANCGAYSWVAANVTGNGTIVCCEPDPVVRRALERTVARNRLKNVHIVSEAVSNVQGKGSFALFDNTETNFLVMAGMPGGDQGKRVEVNLTTLDFLVEQLGLKRLRAVKIDVEGAERMVLEGAVKTLENDDPPALLMEWNECSRNYGYERVELATFLRQYGYRVYRFEGERIVEFDGSELARNAIALKPGSTAFQRVFGNEKSQGAFKTTAEVRR